MDSDGSESGYVERSRIGWRADAEDCVIFKVQGFKGDGGIAGYVFKRGGTLGCRDMDKDKKEKEKGKRGFLAGGRFAYGVGDEKGCGD